MFLLNLNLCMQYSFIYFRQELLRIWDRLILVNVFDSEDSVNLALLRRPDLGITFTKLHAWKLIEYNKCVFLDADTMVLQNVDDLFDRPELSAAPDIGWPDCFNSGVFVFIPSQETHDALVAHALVHGSFDGELFCLSAFCLLAKDISTTFLGLSDSN